MAFNPNAVFISPSTLADIEKCPQLYYYRSVYKTSRGMKLQITNPPLAVGGLVHDVIEQFMKMEITERNWDELVRIFEFLWQNICGEKGGFLSQEEENEAKERAMKMVSRFWNKVEFRVLKGIELPIFPKVELGNDIILTGKLDWVYKENDGYSIIDFKTGKNKEKEDSYQLPIYKVLVNGIFKTENIKAKYWYLDRDEEMEEVILPETKEAIEVLRQKGETVKMIRQTNSFRCIKGGESCWACKDMLAVAKGQGKLVAIDMNRKQEIYILPKLAETKTGTNLESGNIEELPF